MPQREGAALVAGRGGWLRELFPQQADAIAQAEEKIEGMSGVHVALGDQYLGAVGLEDRLRRHAGDSLERMRGLGVRRIAMFTGDRLSVAERVGRAVGVDTIEAECLPEEKHAELLYLQDKGHRTLVVGDGINDGPILATADVGVAMGLSGSDIATNSAGVALMNDDLRHVPFLLELARKTRGVIGTEHRLLHPARTDRTGPGGRRQHPDLARAHRVCRRVRAGDLQSVALGPVRGRVRRGRRSPPPHRRCHATQASTRDGDVLRHHC